MASIPPMILGDTLSEALTVVGNIKLAATARMLSFICDFMLLSFSIFISNIQIYLRICLCRHKAMLIA
ncbi:hypothetical protein VIBNISFn118_770003 [Vibrio nigripulchritudo SFn118]|nr:hypothetical protein VIBNISFn118_770003 [Vibrio nigripulchritudo SFn118]